MPYVKVRIGEPIDKALRALKKKADREGILKAAKKNKHYYKPSIRKREKAKAAAKRDKRARRRSS